jgi:hypothetical protein
MKEPPSFGAILGRGRRRVKALEARHNGPMEPAALMKPMRLRRPTTAERGLAREMFGATIAMDRVRIWSIPVWTRAFVPNGRLIVWPAATAHRDFGDAPLRRQAVFIHELTHVWQAQNGINLLAAKLRTGDRACDYAYDLAEDCAFQARNIEQQAMIFEHAFLARRGHQAPYTAERYAAVLPCKGLA